jgi:8-oxo-dGTP pyrophosphatase MutT (NUDIX family)
MWRCSLLGSAHLFPLAAAEISVTLVAASEPGCTPRVLRIGGQHMPPLKLTSRHIAALRSFGQSSPPLQSAPAHPILKTATPDRLSRKAVVCMPLVNHNGLASVLFTLRSKSLSTHAAQVSFPGGHLELSETPEAAALRELREETGLQGETIARWHPLRAITGTMVTPILGVIVDPRDRSVLDISDQGLARAAQASPDEVERVFAVSLEWLVSPASRQTELLERGFSAPRFSGGPAPIWGLTALFLHYMLADLVVPVLFDDKRRA